jgi:dTDP-4-amino-4,6-dideoxygalactose transaminase
LEALGIKAGDEVVVPTYTFSSTAMVAVHLGATPVLADVDPVTLNITPEAIRKVLTGKTKAVIPVHFAGLPADLSGIRQVAKDYNLKVIEDSAHAFPAFYGGKMIGANTSDATVFSFYATKTITTGEGGMIVSSNEDLLERCKIMRLHGMSRDAFDRYTARGAKWHYNIVAPGVKCNLTDIAACIGIEQLKKASRFLARRTEIARKYLEAFKDLPLVLPSEAAEGDVHSWHLFVIRLKKEAKISRDDFIDEMDKRGIGCSVHFIPLNLQPYYQKTFGYSKGDCPNAENAFYQAVSLPLYTKMTESQVDQVIQTVRSILC